MSWHLILLLIYSPSFSERYKTRHTLRGRPIAHQLKMGILSNNLLHRLLLNPNTLLGIELEISMERCQLRLINFLHLRLYQVSAAPFDFFREFRLFVVEFEKVVVVEKLCNGTHPYEEVFLVYFSVCLFSECHILLRRIQRQLAINIINQHSQPRTINRTTRIQPQQIPRIRLMFN